MQYTIILRSVQRVHFKRVEQLLVQILKVYSI